MPPKSLTSIIALIRSYAKGDFSPRVKATGDEETLMIASELNRLGGQLEERLQNDAGELARLKAAVTELQAEKRALRNILDSTPECIFSVDANLRLLSVNKAFSAFFAQHAGQVPRKGDYIFDHLPYDSKEQAEERYKKALTGQDFVSENRIVAGGKEFWFRARYNPIMEDGQVTGVSVFFREITKEKNDRLALIERKQFTELVLDKVPVDLAVFDGQHRYLYVNSRAIRDGELRAWIIGKDDFDYAELKKSGHAVATVRRNKFKEAIAEKKEVQWIDEHRTKEGALKYILRTHHPVFEDGQLRFVIGYGIDVTDLFRAEKMLAESHNKYRRLLYDMSDAYVMDDVNGKVLFTNPRFLEVFGLRAQDLEQFRLEDYIDPEYLPLFRERHRKQISGETVPSLFEYKGLRKDGKPIWLEVNASPVIENGEIKGTQAIIRDITQRKAQSEEISKLAELNRRIIDASDELFFIFRIVDPGTLRNPLLYVSGKTDEFYGLSAHTIAKKPLVWFESVHPDDIEAVRAGIYKLHVSQQATSMVYRNLKHDTGEYIWVYAYINPIMNARGHVEEVYGSLKNISNLKQKEESLGLLVNELTNKNNELMQFSYIVSHNLRAPIATIAGLSNILAHVSEKGEKERVISGIISSAHKMDEIIKDLNVILSSRAALNEKKEWVQVRESVMAIVSILNREISEASVSVSTVVPDDAATLFTIKSYFESILYNLLSNAIKYHAAWRKPQIDITVTREKDGLVLSVADNGNGIDLEKHREHLFGLYKRFDLEKEGKGLGLHMTKIQVEALGGTIKVESKPGQGSRFDVYLPA